MEKVRVYAHLVRVYGGGGGLFDYSVTPGPLFWELDIEFWVQSSDLDLDHGLDLYLDLGPDPEPAPYMS